MKTLAYAMLLSLFISLLGCVSQPIEPVEMHSPRLGIAQNSDGQATMSWESDRNYYYTIYYQDITRKEWNGGNPKRRDHDPSEFLGSDTKGDNWNELRSVNRVRGTGGTMTVSDRVNPRRRIIRRYRLHFEKSGATGSRK